MPEEAGKTPTEELESLRKRLAVLEAEHLRASLELERFQKIDEETWRRFDFLPAMVVIINSLEEITSINRAGCEILGYKRSELIGRNWFDLCLPEDVREEVRRIFGELMADQTDLTEFYVNDVISSKGLRISIHWHNSLVTDMDGRITGTISIGEDIARSSDKHDIEARHRYFLEGLLDEQTDRLEEGERHYHDLIESLHAGVVVHAPDTSILLCNAEAARLLGLSVDEMLGRKAPDPAWFFTDENGDQLPVEDYPVNRVISSGRALKNFVACIHRPVTKDRTCVLCNAFPEFDSKGELKQVVVTFIDITLQRNALEELRAREETYRALVDSMPDAVVATDLRGKVTEVSRRVLELFGYDSPEEVLGRNVIDWFAPEDRERAVEDLSRLPEVGRLLGIEFRVLRSDGSTILIELSLAVVNDASGRPFRLVGSIRDITASRMLEDQLRQSQRIEAVGRLAGGVAHDFNNLLTAILGYCDLMKSDIPEGSNLAQDLGEIWAAAEKAAELTRQLLAFSRRQALQPRTVSLNQIVSNLCRMIKRVIGEEIIL